MKGKHHIIIESARLKYEFDIFSWERFFTDFLKKETENNPVCQYSKDKLKPFYYEGKNREKILSLIPGINS